MEEERSLFDFRYQRARVELGKRFGNQKTTCCQSCMVGIFKHLIHLFALTFIVSFGGMLYLINDDKTDDMGLRTNEVKQVQMLDYYISHHPMYYGLTKVGQQIGLIEESKNITDGLMKLAAKYQREKEVPNIFIHPLYVQL